MELKCPYCHLKRDLKSESRTIRRRGRFFRKSDAQYLVRLSCERCGKHFSAATHSRKFGQKKRQFNRKICELLCAGVSQREAARVLKLNRKTVVRKFRFLLGTAYDELIAMQKKYPEALEIEFDDLETFEHTKLKPLSVTLIVEYRTRRIIGFRVSSMPAKGVIARLARKKYGRRKDERRQNRRALFKEVQGVVAKNAKIRSDSNPHYLKDVKEYFPQATYETVPGGRAAVVGQGELKKLKWDPIFSLNHTCAMLRAHINRLFRKTWCTTKRADQLAGHIALYALEHNRRLASAA